jgi:hypothetical protein
MKKPRNQISERVGQYRVRMQERGFRQVNLWVPDTRSPSFAKECRRQSLLAAKTDRNDGILDALDATASDIEDWTA